MKKERIAIESIKLENGIAEKKFKNRTIMSETGLPEGTMVEYIGNQSRWTGTGYSNSLYRIVGTDDLLTIRHNDGSVNNIAWDSVQVTKDFFVERKRYADVVGTLSRKYHIPFEIGLVLGENEEIYQHLINVLANIKDTDADTVDDLYGGINRRKKALKTVLGKKLYNKIGIDSMGQKNSERLATFVAEKCR